MKENACVVPIQPTETLFDSVYAAVWTAKLAGLTNTDVFLGPVKFEELRQSMPFLPFYFQTPHNFYAVHVIEVNGQKFYQGKDPGITVG